jgi:predicted transcriptional regulator
MATQYPEQIVVRLKPETRKKLEQRAEREDRKPMALARQIIEKALLKEKL